MKCLTRYLSLFCCLLLLLGFSSLTADAVTTYPYHVYSALNVRDEYDAGTYGVNCYPYDDEVQSRNEWVYFYVAEGDTLRFTLDLSVAYDDKSVMVEKDRQAKVMLNNCFASFLFDKPSSDATKLFGVPDNSTKSLTVTYTDGTSETFKTVTVTRYTDGTFNLTGTFNAKKDVSSIKFTVDCSLTWSNIRAYADYDSFDEVEGINIYKTLVYYSIGEQDILSSQLELDVQSEEAGLLDSILAFLGTIKNKIEDTWNAITEGFTNVVSSLTEGFENLWNALIELPENIWNWIEEGLQALFIPGPDVINGLYDDFTDLLALKLGCAFSVADYIYNILENCLTADKTNTIYIPEVTLYFYDKYPPIETPEGDVHPATFSFGGEDVNIVPDRFEGIVDALKIIIGCICTIAFMNGLRKRYDEVMGVEQ